MNRTVHARIGRCALAVAALVATMALPAIAWAQQYPTRPIKIIVGFSPGGVTDAIPRLLAEPMSRILGQPVIVENRTGAGGGISATMVAQAPPDGYTLLGGGVGVIVVLPHTSPNMAINPVTDLAHITITGEGDQYFTIPAELPVKSYAEFAEYVKKNPGKMFYGDSGAGGNLHLYLEYFKVLSGLDLEGVHYKGGSDIMIDLIANRVQLSLSTLLVIQPYVATGRLRPILMIGKQRNPQLPDVATVAEVGLKDLESVINWFSLHAPKGTPAPIIAKLHAAVVEALKTDEVKAGLAKLDIRPVGNSPEDFTRRVNEEYKTYGDIIKRANLKF